MLACYSLVHTCSYDVHVEIVCMAVNNFDNLSNCLRCHKLEWLRQWLCNPINSLPVNHFHLSHGSKEFLLFRFSLKKKNIWCKTMAAKFEIEKFKNKIVRD